MIIYHWNCKTISCEHMFNLIYSPIHWWGVIPLWNEFRFWTKCVAICVRRWRKSKWMKVNVWAKACHSMNVQCPVHHKQMKWFPPHINRIGCKLANYCYRKWIVVNANDLYSDLIQLKKSLFAHKHRINAIDLSREKNSEPFLDGIKSIS